MSVPVGKRSETKLEVIGNAEKLAAYTIRIVSNEKHFKKRYRWCFGSQIVDKAVEINTLVHQANGIYAKTKDDMKLRLRYELEALADVDGLMSLITIAKADFEVSLTSSEIWLNTAVKERNLLKRFRERDFIRLGELPE